MRGTSSRQLKEATMASRVYVDSPTTTPLPYGLLSVADDRGSGDAHWQQGVEYDSDNCTVTLATAAGYCIAPPGTNAIQTFTVTGVPTGGSYKLTYFGETTTAIPYNATAAQFQAALESTAQINPGDVSVSGNGPYVVTWQGNYASEPMPFPTVTNNLTGGASPNVSIQTTQAGLQNPKSLTYPAATIATDPFTVYLIRACAPVGDVDAQGRAMKMFNGSEQIGVEKGFWSQITKSGAGAVDITPGAGGTITPAIGLAMLEQYAAQHYGGRPTIHCSRGVGSLLGSHQSIERHGNQMETVLGAKVSAGGGYDPQTGPNGAGATSQQAWMFVTGEVSLWKGAAEVHGPTIRQSSVQQNQPVNEWIVMVERTYLTSPDCMIAAIKCAIDTVP
jgi:hypothetical protein